MAAADAIVIVDNEDISDVCYLRSSINYGGGTKLSTITYPLADKMDGGTYRYEGREPQSYEFEIKTTDRAVFEDTLQIVENAEKGAVCQVGRTDRWFELHTSSTTLENPPMGINVFYRAKVKLYAKQPYTFSTTQQYLDAATYGTWEDFTNNGQRDSAPRYLSVIGQNSATSQSTGITVEHYMSDRATEVESVLICDELNSFEILDVDFPSRKITQRYTDDYITMGSSLWTQDKADGALGSWSSGKITLTATSSAAPAWYAYYFPGPWPLSKPIALTNKITVTGNADNAHLYYQSTSDMRFIDVETIESGVEKTYYVPVEGLEDVWIIWMSSDSDVTLDVYGVTIETERMIPQSEVEKLMVPRGETRSFRVTETDAIASMDAYLEYEDRYWG